MRMTETKVVSMCPSETGWKVGPKVALASGRVHCGKVYIFQIIRKYDYGNKNLKFIFKIRNKCLHLGKRKANQSIFPYLIWYMLC